MVTESNKEKYVIKIKTAGKKPLLTSAQWYMGTSPGGSASPVT